VETGLYFHITCSAVAKKIPTKYRRLGVTSINDELFVLLDRIVNQVAVYCIDDSQLLRRLHAPGLKPNDNNDITSCVRRNCLYMSDYRNSCIHRYDLDDGTTSSCPVYGKPVGLSVTPVSCNLLVTCQGRPNKLVELSYGYGEWVWVGEIALRDSEIEWPWHSIELNNDDDGDDDDDKSDRSYRRFVVCHGLGSSGVSEVCIVNDDGDVTGRYGGKCGSNDKQLREPRNLAVDEDSRRIFVADYYNARVVELSPTLHRERYARERLTDRPWRLHLHESSRSLFVAPLHNRVIKLTVEV